jgi:hypothetical protein
MTPARLNVAGQIHPAARWPRFGLKLDGIELAAIQPYIAQYTSMTLLEGALSGDAKVRYGAQKPALQFSGNISVAKLHTVDNALHEDFINWDRLDVSGINFQHDPDRLDIDQITAPKPVRARHYRAGRPSMNVKRVLAGPGATVVAPSGARSASAGRGHGAAPAPDRATSDAAASPRGRKKRLPARRQTASRPARRAAPPMPMSIKKIVLQAGQANFADLSVTPNFRHRHSKARRHGAGPVVERPILAPKDRYCTVGRCLLRPWPSPARSMCWAALYTDLAMSFRNIELSTFNPYSGKFAGYNIAKGKLTTELHYKVDGRKLDAQHHIVVDQLEFGDKTESKDAVSLPIKLAVSCSRDRDGVIELDLPVTGSLDDPPVQARSDHLEGVRQYPGKSRHRALRAAGFSCSAAARICSSSTSSRRCRSGSGAVPPRRRAIVKALNERPQLKIEVPIAWSSALDRPSLIDATSSRRRSTRRRPPLRRARNPCGDGAELRAARPGCAPGNPDPAVPKEPGQRAEVPGLRSAHQGEAGFDGRENRFPEQRTAQHIQRPSNGSDELGQQRAMNLQQAACSPTHRSIPRGCFWSPTTRRKARTDKVRWSYRCDERFNSMQAMRRFR